MRLFIFLVAFAFFACGQNQTSAQNEPPSVNQQIDVDSLVIKGDREHLFPRADLQANMVISRELVDGQLVTVWRVPRTCEHETRHELFDALIRHTYSLENSQWKRESEEIGYVDDSLVKYVYQ